MGRLDQLPPYLFSAIDAAKEKARQSGVQVVDLGVGDPDRPTPSALVEVMARALQDARHHGYPAQRGDLQLREAIAAWLQRRHGIQVDPLRQVLVLVGSKEGLGHLPLALVQEGDNTLVPDIGYPVYGQATTLAGGSPRTYSLTPERAFLPDPTELASLRDDRTRMVTLNYPHNPTGAVADEAFWSRMIADFAGGESVLVNDAAYLEVTLDGSRLPSMLSSADLERDRVIEFHSLSKMFNMTGWRIAFAVGHEEVVGDLARVKESLDSGVFGAIQATAAHALSIAGDGVLDEVMSVYPARRRILVEALRDSGFEVFETVATFYVWVRVPTAESAMEFCGRCLAETGVVATPGNGFGPGGEGWFRLSLTAADEDIAEAGRRFRGWS